MTSLDGLRGLAAVCVVICHVMIAAVPALAGLFFVASPHLSGVQQALAWTPLHFFWAGQEWVIVFFVLSGLVLSLAASNGAAFEAGAYYPARFVRLYVPVWGALLVAGILHGTVSHAAVPGASPWLNEHGVPLTFQEVWTEASLVYHAGDGFFTTVLWSLKFEVLFSILLPAYIWCARRWPAGSALVALILLTAGAHNEYLRYLSPFMLGTVLAFQRDRIRSGLERLPALPVAVLGLCLLSADWWLPGSYTSDAGSLGVALGATLLVALAMTPGAFRGLLETRPFQIVGRRSFSLYLVHEPLVVALAFALGGRPSPWLLLGLTAPAVALLTEAFYRLVERPSHQLARLAAGVLADGRRRQRVPA